MNEWRLAQAQLDLDQPGVDIQYVEREFRFEEVAAGFFTGAEVATLRSLPWDLQRQIFLKCWSSKEAFLKAKGTGLSGELDEVEITLGAAEQVRICADVAGWSLAELNPVDAYEAAIVVASGALPVRCYQWEADSENI